MSELAIQQLLSQMRTLEAELRPVPPLPQGEASPAAFGNLLEEALRAVNSQQTEATRLASELEAGNAGVDVAQVMIEVQRATLAFKAMTEVRNRLVNAYQDIMNMPV
jgi:flagellar hook-basal body complex protein FliE